MVRNHFSSAAEPHWEILQQKEKSPEAMWLAFIFSNI